MGVIGSIKMVEAMSPARFVMSTVSSKNKFTI